MFLGACDEFLDINPDSEVVNDDLYANETGVESAVFGLYGEMIKSNLYGEQMSWMIPEILAQNLDIPQWDVPYEAIGEYNYNDAKELIKSIWKDTYEVIGHSNNIIINLEERKDDSYAFHLGESYGIRAFMHFEMLRYFAPHIEYSPTAEGIPYVTNYSFKHTPFSTVEEVYSKIIADLIKAQELLAEDPIEYPRNSDDLTKNFLKGRELHFNLYAATALLSRVYWMKGDLPNAKKEALKVINSNKFPLANKDEIRDLIAGTLSPKESVWGLFSRDYFETTSDRFISQLSTQSINVYTATSGGNYLLPYDEVYNEYLGDNSGTDFRLGWYRSIAEGNSFISCLKVSDVLRYNSPSSTPSSRSLHEGISLIRIPEMYYIIAEAELEAGNIGEASRYINQVLVSRGLTVLEDRDPVIIPDIELLYNERHKELFCEGQRWFDMKKRNMDIYSNVKSSILPASDEIYVLPIPIEEYDYRNE